MSADVSAVRTAVGYKAESLREGFTMMTPTFVPVADAGAGLDLLDLIAGGTYDSDVITVQTLNYDGTTDKMYSYGKDRYETWFWQDVDEGTTIEKGDVTFTSGQGLWVGGVDAATLTNAGVVSTDDTKVALREGFTASGNMTAVEIDLTAIIPGGEYDSDVITIQTLNYDGTTDKMYSFGKDRQENWFWQDVDAGIAIEEGDVVFQPGQGFWVGGVDGATITIPGPTL